MPRGVPVQYDKKMYKLVVFAYFVQEMGKREIERNLKISRPAIDNIISQVLASREGGSK